MNKRILYTLIWILLFHCSVIQAQSFEEDWQRMKFKESINGVESLSYEYALLELIGNNLQDSVMISYYDSIATRLIAIIPQIENRHGISSAQYGNLIDVCSYILIESADKHVKIKKRKQIVNFLKSLENNYHQAGENEYMFAIGLSEVYSYLGDVNKAVYWGQIRFDYAKELNDMTELAAAYGILAELYIKYHKNEESAALLNDVIEDSEISSQNKRVIIDYFINTCYEMLSYRDKSDVVKCLLNSKDKRFADLQALCNKAAEHKDYFIFDIIENSENFTDFSIEDRFEYYKWNSTGFSIYDNPQRCIDYLLKAIYYAQSNNRDDLNWHYHGSDTIKTHNWYWVAFHYQFELLDKTNALKYLEINLTATKDFYGEYSVNYYNELKTLSNNYDLWYNDIEKASIYDSIASRVSKNVFGINSEEHVNSLLDYISCLRRQEQYNNALSLCIEYLSNADTTNVYLHGIYNQAAMCCYSLGMYEEALSFYFKAIDNTDDKNCQSTYALNLSSLLVERNGAEQALELIEKFQPQSNNPYDKYTFLNTKAKILANIDQNKAYKTFCEAELYENLKDVRLQVGRQITHYMNKAEVAPDLHLRFSALQQALKIFDNNNTSDSLMYAHIIADMADYYDDVMDIEKAVSLYEHASDVYIRNSREISIDFLDFCDRTVLFELALGHDSVLINTAELLLEKRKQLQGEMNPLYNIRRFQLLDTYCRFGYNAKADSLAEEIISAQLPEECIQDKNYYLGIYEQYSRKDLKKAAVYYENYLSSTDFSIGGTRIYGNLMDIYKELGELNKFDSIEDKYISTWYQDVESKWYHITDKERQNYLQLLKGWQIELASYACTPKSIENAVNASLFCKGRLTQTTKAINDELYRLKKSVTISGTTQTRETDTNIAAENSVSISDYIINSQDSIDRSIIYNDLSTKRLKNLVNSNLLQVKNTLLKSDVGIDFIDIDTTTIYAYIINKNRPVELKQLSFSAGDKTLSRESLDYISSFIKGAKRVFFSPSETMSINTIESFFRSRFPNVEVHRVLSLR